jgi:rubrerythrin
MTFKVKLEKVAKKEGYSTIQELVCHLLVDEKMTFTDLTNYIQEKYGINRTYSAMYAALRKFAPENFNINTRFNQSREDLAKSKGYESFKAMLLDFVDRKLNYREIANEIGQKSPINVKRLEKIYGIKLAANHRTRLAGFVNQARYRFWLEKAKEMGYNSIEEALNSMKKDKSAKEIAALFEVSSQSLWRRVKRLERRKL